MATKNIEIVVSVGKNSDDVAVVVTDFGDFEILLCPKETREYAKILLETADLVEAGGNSVVH